MLRWRLWYSSALLLVALPAVVKAQIYSVQHEPRDVANDLGPEQLAILGVNRNGPQSDTAIKYQSQFIYVGCFWAPMNITMDSEQDTSFDPAECVEVCKTKPPIVPSAEVVAAVQGKRCGCVKPYQTEDNPARLMQMFEPSDQPTVDCQTGCKFYDNPLCGGNEQNQYWGVFKEYDYQSMSSQGAYDPWRYVWYTVVVVLERTLKPDLQDIPWTKDAWPKQDDDTLVPIERYYLSAIDQQSGKPKFEFQTRLPGIVQGLQFDLDSNRLVGLLISNEIGRVRMGYRIEDETPGGYKWEYKLLYIFINTTIPTYPNMTFENDYPIIQLQEDIERDYFLYTGASAIVSKANWDTYVFVLIQDQNDLRASKNNIYFVQIPTGEVLLTNTLDMRVLQLFSNEKYGDVTVAAISYQRTVWLYIARVVFNELTRNTEIKFLYTSSRPQYLVNPPTPVETTWLMPGAACSEHLFNKSYSLLRNYSTNYLDDRPRNETGILMMEVLLRAQTNDFFCDKDAGCWNSMNETIPYAAIFNREPRIPLSLKSPELISAKFNMEATTITAIFDQATLKGAIPIDTNNDILPDMIDYNSQLTGNWDCARIFDDDTVVLIGPFRDGTICEWTSDNTIKITLPLGEKYPDIDVGDQLTLRADSTYTVPRDGEYSAAGQGGIEVSLPDPLFPPFLAISGATEVDECTPVEFSAVDSYFTGGKPQYNWSLNEYPIDLWNNPAGRSWDQEKISYVYEALSNATTDNLAVLSLDTQKLSPAAKYMIKVVITSRWGLNTSEIVPLTRLDFPSPLVSIVPSQAEIITNRTEQVVLTANGKPSDCPGITRELGYRWTETSGQLDLATVDGLVYTTKTLIIPRFTLDTAGDDQNVVYRVYNFTVECYVVAQPDRAAYDNIVVKVQRSPIFVHLTVEDRLLTRGKDLILDARQSQDPDYPTANGLTFRGTFSYWCVGPANTPCFSDLDGFYVGTDSGAQELATCNTVANEKITFGGRVFSVPAFVIGFPPYCRWARGVLMATTRNFTIDNYTWTIQAKSYDGRKANKTVLITMTQYDVPNIRLEISNPRPKYATTSEIRVLGTIESELDPTAPLEFIWSLWKYTLNPAYDPDAALLAEQNGDVYDVPQFYYQDVSNELNLTNPLDPAKFLVDPTVPNMVIKSNVLKESTVYKLRLTTSVHNGAVMAFTDLGFETAGPAPRPGELLCDPMSGNIKTERQLSAPDWVADDLPLTYKFGYYKKTVSLTYKVPLHAEVIQVSSITKTLPLGDKEANFSLTLYVEVYTPFGAINSVELVVQVRPPTNVSDAIDELLTRMEAPGADPELTLEDAQTVLDIKQIPPVGPGEQPSQEDTELIDRVLTAADKAFEGVPSTKATNLQMGTIIGTAAESGVKSDILMDSLDGLVLDAATADPHIYDIQDLTNARQHLAIIGSLYPNCPTREHCVTSGSGGRRLEAVKALARPETDLAPGRRLAKTSSIGEDPDHVASAAFPRRQKNHPVQKHPGEVLHSCSSAYCDKIYLVCLRKQRRVFVKGFDSELVATADYFPRNILHTCCDAANPRTMCKEPPCWFRGSGCPRTEDSDDMSRSSREERERRLEAQPEKSNGSEWAWQWSEELGYGSMSAHKSAVVTSSAYPAKANTSFHDSTSDDLTEALEDIYRRLQASQPLIGSRGVESEERIQFLEDLEAPILQAVTSELSIRNRQKEQQVRADARQEMFWETKDQVEYEQLKAQAQEDRAQKLDQTREDERNFSQTITRVGVLRDTICKTLIPQMTTSVEVLRLDVVQFTLWLGKTRNMSAVRPSMIFPDKFIVPPNTPDYPTADNPLSAFAFIYIEYKQNIYGWSDSAPPGNESNIQTIIVMKASTTEVEIKNEIDPIRIFADESLYSSALCMFWDRFAPDTAGGAWSTRGLLNDGEGCLTTHLSDLGLFVDGRLPTSILVDKAVSYYLEDVIDGPEGAKYNLQSVVVVGFAIFLGTVLALAGYIQDELVRERERAGKAPHTHWLGGNGVTSAINVDDCIAYNHVDHRHWFLVVTLWKVILRDHAVLGLAKYHAAFTRPQRVLCLGVMATSILAVNAMIYGVPKELVSGDQFVPSGVISGLVSFPLFVACMFMFASRPTQLKKRLIKRAADTSTVDAMRKERQRIEHESAKLYPRSYPALPPIPMAPQGFISHQPLLALPAAVPLWPTVPPPPGMSLPPPPPTSMLPLTQGTLPVAGQRGPAGLPSLPPLPPLKNNFQALPPPPKYNPPSATLSRPGLPPPGRALAQLPPHPAEQARMSNMSMPAVVDGARTPPEMPTPPDTGRNNYPQLAAPSTPPQAKTPPQPQTPPGGPNRAPDQEMTTTLPGSFAPEGTHGTAPDAVADREDTPAEREFQDDAQHGMMGYGAPPPPPPGPPPDDDFTDGGFATPRTPLSRPPSEFGSFQNPPPPIMTPPSGPGLYGIGATGISASGIVYRGEAPPMIPPPAYAPGLGTQPPRHPPEPPNALRLPQMPGLPKPQAMMPPPGFGLPLGVPGPLVPGHGGIGLPPGLSSIPPPGFMMGAGGYEEGRKPLPPPPPPPKEDNAVFVRRMRLHGLERSSKEADRRMVDHYQDVAKDIPRKIFFAMTFCPYLACTISICAQIFITLAYSMKFQRISERYWYYSTIIGLCEVLVVLEFMRSAVMMIVELRKFEIRKRLYGGAFNKSRVGRKLEGPDALQPNKKIARTPAVPTVAPKKPSALPPPQPPKAVELGPPPLEALSPPEDGSNPRPAFLPPLPGGSGLTPPGSAGGTGMPPLPGVSLPVGKAPPSGAPPSHKMPTGMAPLDFSRGMPGTNTPPRGSLAGSLGQAGGKSLLPGVGRSNTPPSGFGTPKLGMSQSYASTTQGEVPAPPPVPSLKAGSPTGSVASNMSRSLAEQMAASRTVKQPTPPGSRPGSQRGQAKPPSAPPSGSPASQSLAQKRSAMRGQ